MSHQRPFTEESMKGFSLLLLLAFLSLSSPAFADPVPKEALDQDFSACMGGETEQKDPQRAEYCNCVRDGMKRWDTQSYANVAQQAAQNPTTENAPAKITELAKTCISKILK